MAVNQTLTFGSVTSSTYNIYISGEGVFNAPKRDTKIVTIPGRNGEFAQDQGRFENITVTYPAFYQATSLSSFAQNLANFRAAMCSQIGYQRLTDTINNTEYRQALFIDGINFTPAKDDTFATFDLVFNCKPQRWLTSGETVQTFSTNTLTLNNATKFGAYPLFVVEGYGEMSNTNNGTSQVLFNVANNTYGQLNMLNAFTIVREPTAGNATYGQQLDNYSLLATGDTIVLSPITFRYGIDTHGATITNIAITNEAGSANAVITTNQSNSNGYVEITFSGLSLAAGTSQTATKTFTLTVTFNPGGQTWSKNIEVKVLYGGNEYLDYYITGGANPGNITVTPVLYGGKVTGYSTKTVSGKINIDCENGLAWYDINGAISDANNIVTFPTELPAIPPGTNTVTKSATLTSAKVTPRWWTI